MFGRDPLLKDGFATDLMNFIGVEELFAHIEASDISDARSLDVPVPSDSRRVVPVQHGVENRLIRQSRRPPPEVCGFHQIEFFWAGWTPQRDDVWMCGLVAHDFLIIVDAVERERDGSAKVSDS